MRRASSPDASARFRAASASSHVVAAAFVLVACGGPAPRIPIRPSEQATTQIISPKASGTVDELFGLAERALLEQKWNVAIENLETLVQSREGSPPMQTRARFNLAIAYEGAGNRAAALVRYEEVLHSQPEAALARLTRVRLINVLSYLELWPKLRETGDALLSEPDLSGLDRALALGARALGAIELGDDTPAARDVQEGLDRIDELRIGADGKLPLSAAQLRFALGEVRRVRSEKIKFTNAVASGVVDPAQFLVKLEARCQLLMDAQHAFTDAMRAADPHWAVMAGFRTGEMYKTLHADVTTIPAPATAKGDKQKQIFFAIMHVRYRVLLEKALAMFRATVLFKAYAVDSSDWTERAEHLKSQIESAIESEKQLIKTFPFSEGEVERAIEIMREHYEKKQKKKWGGLLSDQKQLADNGL